VQYILWLQQKAESGLPIQRNRDRKHVKNKLTNNLYLQLNNENVGCLVPESLHGIIISLSESVEEHLLAQPINAPELIGHLLWGVVLVPAALAVCRCRALHLLLQPRWQRPELGWGYLVICVIFPQRRTDIAHSHPAIVADDRAPRGQLGDEDKLRHARQCGGLILLRKWQVSIAGLLIEATCHPGGEVKYEMEVGRPVVCDDGI